MVVGYEYNNHAPQIVMLILCLKRARHRPLFQGRGCRHAPVMLSEYILYMRYASILA